MLKRSYLAVAAVAMFSTGAIGQMTTGSTTPGTGVQEGRQNLQAGADGAKTRKPMKAKPKTKAKSHKIMSHSTSGSMSGDSTTMPGNSM